jgi:hypothetical protein
MPSRRNVRAGPTPVDAIVRNDKRMNLPAADPLSIYIQERVNRS